MWEKTASKQERTKIMAMKRMRTKIEERVITEGERVPPPNFGGLKIKKSQSYRLSPKA